MKIICDITFAADGVTPIGAQYIDLDPAAAASSTLPDGVTKVRPIDTVAMVQADKTKLQAAGFLELTHIPGHPAGTTKWQIIVAEANKATAIPEVKALNLT